MPISGPGSVGQFVALGAAIELIVTFIGGPKLLVRSLLGWPGMASMLAMSFEGAVVFALSAAVLAAAGQPRPHMGRSSRP